MEKKINLEKKKVILIAFGILLISFVYALPPIPPLPDHFIGDVTIDGQNAPVGTQISIYVNSALEGSVLTTVVGEYDLYVKSGNISDGIEFKIDNKVAGNSIRGWGETTYLNLSITTTPSNPPSPPGGNGGGGGGSGGGGGIINQPPATINESTPDSEENTTQTLEIGEQAETGLGITGAVIGFLGSSKGIITIMVILILGIGVILIKFKTPKWKRNFS